MRELRRPLILLLRLCLSAVLLYAAAAKWPAPRAFAEDVANFRLLPPALVPLGTVLILGTETLCGLLLLLPMWRRETALLTALLMGLFSAAVASALLRDLRIECGCFGAGGDPATVLTLVRDLGLLGMAATLYVLQRGTGRQIPSP